MDTEEMNMRNEMTEILVTTITQGMQTATRFVCMKENKAYLMTEAYHHLETKFTKFAEANHLDNHIDDPGTFMSTLVTWAEETTLAYLKDKGVMHPDDYTNWMGTA